MNSRNNKLIINACLMRKESDFSTKPCVIEKAVAVSSEEFEHLKMHPLHDNDHIAENKEAMRYDPKDNTDHCLLIYDKDNGDGLLIESEGYDYARYAQYVPNAKLIYEDYVQKNPQNMRLYCPLVITADLEDNYDDPEELNDTEKIICEDAILGKIQSDEDIFDDERGLMKYYGEKDSVDNAVFSAYPSVEKRDGTLMGVFVCKVSPDITHDQIDRLKEYLTGQASDGWGEGFEQHEIHTSEFGNIYVSFWSSGDEWSLLTEEELIGDNGSQSENMDMTM